MTIKESALGPPVVAWLAEQGFEVYQEVEAWAGVADLVGVCGPQLAVVEMKVALSFELLYQATRWRSTAHVVYVAVPRAKSPNARAMAERCFADRGLGVLSVAYAGTPDAVCDVTARPAFNRNANVELVRGRLRDEQKTFAAAGSQGGRRWTDFKATVARIKTYLGEHPGATVREVVRDIEHHYASDAGARARLVDLIQRGVVPGVRAERARSGLRLHLIDGGA